VQTSAGDSTEVGIPFFAPGIKLTVDQGVLLGCLHEHLGRAGLGAGHTLLAEPIKDMPRRKHGIPFQYRIGDNAVQADGPTILLGNCTAGNARGCNPCHVCGVTMGKLGHQGKGTFGVFAVTGIGGNVRCAVTFGLQKFFQLFRCMNHPLVHPVLVNIVGYRALTA